MNKNFKIILIITIIIVLSLAGFFVWKKFKTSQSQVEKTVSEIEKTSETAEIITESATQGILPSINSTANPYENISETNPIEKANPFKDIKINPFK